MVARPAARRLRTQLTSPQGAQTQRLPEISMTATAVVRGRPLFRPRMVTSRLGPSGTPAANRNWRIRPKNLTLRGTRAALTIRLLISWLLLVPIRSAFHTSRRPRRRGRDRRLDELEPSAGHGEIQLAEPVRIRKQVEHHDPLTLHRNCHDRIRTPVDCQDDGVKVRDRPGPALSPGEQWSRAFRDPPGTIAVTRSLTSAGSPSPRPQARALNALLGSRSRRSFRPLPLTWNRCRLRCKFMARSICSRCGASESQPADPASERPQARPG